MSILCGTDFSNASRDAVAVAALLAERTGSPLHLMHSVEMPEAPGAPFGDWLDERLSAEAGRVARPEVGVTTHVRSGAPDETIQELASEVGATLIVVAALGTRRPGPRQLGSHSDAIAHRSRVPVLVVRDAAPFAEWVRGERPLRITFGADHTASSEAAMRWLSTLRKIGPCEVVGTHLYSAPEQFRRLGLGGIRSYVDADPEVVRTLERELSERYAKLPGAGSIRFHVEPHIGMTGDRLANLAAEQHADLVVVGSHARGAMSRLWEGSVSRTVLVQASSSVACVPAPEASGAVEAARFRVVVAATDFSPIGDAALPLAFGAVAAGGTVHLVHVVKHSPGRRFEPSDIFDRDKEEADELHVRLRALIPDDASARIEVHVVESKDVAEGLCQAAERLGADLVCLGTHGRTGLSKVVLGSVAQAVMEKTRRPLLLARAPAD